MTLKLQTKRERRERESLRFAESIWQVFEWMCAAGSGESSLLFSTEPGLFGALDVARPMGPSFEFCELQLVDSSSCPSSSRRAPASNAATESNQTEIGDSAMHY